MGFINDLVTKNHKFVLRKGIGTGYVTDMEGNLALYNTWSGEICNASGEPLAVLEDVRFNSFSIYTPDEQYLGSGKFTGLFVDADGAIYNIPILGKLANQAKKMVSSRSQY